MISPKIYEKQIQDLGIEGKEISPNSKEDALNILEELEDIEKVLNHIRLNIRMDTRALRRDYVDKLKEIGDFSRTEGKNVKKSLKNKIKEKRDLIDDRDLRIAPYESIEYLIDDYLKQINSAKSYVIDYSKKNP